jgi:Mitochondrial carrier protein
MMYTVAVLRAPLAFLFFTIIHLNNLAFAALSSAKSASIVSAGTREGKLHHSGKVLPFLPDGIKNSIASAGATAVVKFVLQPLDTIKTIQQAKGGASLGPLGATMKVIKDRGIMGLWSGIDISVRGIMCNLAQIFVY